MALAAERRLAAEEGVINALNVFPVPDGDTGSNMLATVRQALAQAAGAASPAEAAERLAKGAMLGARGNSGVLLAQLFRAQREVLAGCDATPADLAPVLARAAELASAALANPVEGTMLSVLRVLAGTSLEAMVGQAEAALARTPDQLPLLREAGVVDSGGYGLLAVLRGWHEALAGEPVSPTTIEFLGVERARAQAAAGRAHPADLVPDIGREYGSCVTVLVEAPGADEEDVRARLQRLGNSALVAAVDGQLKLHVHVPDPEIALAFARELGAILGSEISNIDEQVGAGATAPVVAVAFGDGLARVFRGLGAAVVDGGQTRNPSTAELLAACDHLPAPVYLLPNNGNVLAAAGQAAKAREGVLVVPTRSIPAGVAAALAYDPAASAKDNLGRMSHAAEGVRAAELVPAARAARLHGVQVDAGQMMVVLEGELLGVEEAGLAALAARVAEADTELLTIYYGAGHSEGEAARLGERFPDLQVEIVRGDQPVAAFILGFE